jgi:hypothetical protein
VPSAVLPFVKLKVNVICKLQDAQQVTLGLDVADHDGVAMTVGLVFACSEALPQAKR